MLESIAAMRATALKADTAYRSVMDLEARQGKEPDMGKKKALKIAAEAEVPVAQAALRDMKTKEAETKALLDRIPQPSPEHEQLSKAFDEGKLPPIGETTYKTLVAFTEDRAKWTKQVADRMHSGIELVQVLPTRVHNTKQPEAPGAFR